jgi:hypothetical protein
MPGLQSRRDRYLSGLALAGCAGSLLPLPLLFAGLWPMRLSVPFLVPPSLLLLLALAVYARSWGAPRFWALYAAGFAGGLIATIVYDAVRALGLFVRFPGFQVIHVFGMLITGQSEFTPVAAVLGWLYHFLNGGVFGIVYALIAGRGSVWWGMGWGLFLEAGMLLTYPKTFGIDMGWGSVALTFSLLGHLAYGATLAIAARRLLAGPMEIHASR